MQYTQSEIIKAQALTASTTYPFDLGIQGISYLWMEIEAQQNAAHTIEQPDDLFSCISNITVSNGGQAIVSGRAKDLARLGSIIAGVPYRFTAASDATSAEAAVSFILPFGRRIFDPTEGLPQTKRGMLQVAVTAAAAFTPVKLPHVTIHQVEVPGNSFRRYNKYTQRTATPSATGLYDFPLPIGNYLRGVFAAGSTAYRNEASQGTYQQTILMVNNAETYWTGGISGHANHIARTRMPEDATTQVASKLENTAAMYAQNALTDAGLTATVPREAFNAYLDLDPLRDDVYTLDTNGLNLLSLRLDMAIAEQAWVLAYESVAIR